MSRVCGDPHPSTISQSTHLSTTISCGGEEPQDHRLLLLPPPSTTMRIIPATLAALLQFRRPRSACLIINSSNRRPSSSSSSFNRVTASPLDSASATRLTPPSTRRLELYGVASTKESLLVEPKESESVSNIPDASSDAGEPTVSSSSFSKTNHNITPEPYDNNENPYKYNIHTRFILIEPKHRGNVGGAARALKTMGFDDLVLVRPHDAKVLRRNLTKQGASGATGILQAARVVATLREALEDFENDNNMMVCATGMPIVMTQGRERLMSKEDEEEEKKEDVENNVNKSDENEVKPAPHLQYMAPRPFFEQYVQSLQQSSSLSNQDDDDHHRPRKIALVFGNEKYGMRQADTNQCQVVLGIPTHPEFGSLNLAAAVQLIAYDWRQALGGF